MSNFIKHTFDPSTDAMPKAKTEFFQNPNLDEYEKAIPADAGESATNDPTEFKYNVGKPKGVKEGSGQAK